MKHHSIFSVPLISSIPPSTPQDYDFHYHPSNFSSLKELFLNTLRGRLLLILLLSTLIPVLLIGSSSFYFIYTILNNKIEKEINENLNQVKLYIEDALGDLNFTCQQFLYHGLFEHDFHSFIFTDDPFRSSQLAQKISRDINLIHFTNPNMSLGFYYLPESDEVFFNNLEVRKFDFSQLPIISKQGNIIFHGPHQTLYRYSANTVFSVLGKIVISDGESDVRAYVYIESGFGFLNEIMELKNENKDAFYLLLDDQKSILLSERNDEFPLGAKYIQTKEGTGKYYFFEQKSDMGWTLVMGISKKEYESETRKWSKTVALMVILSFAISIFFAFSIWNTVNKPLLRLTGSIKRIADNKEQDDLKLEKLDEFNYVINHINNMRHRISELINDIEQEEKDKRELEVQKLLAQINPHFLYNTLNSVQWLAKINGQAEIDRLVTVFVRVLEYNLAKDGLMVTIEEEINALKNYIELQQIKYDHSFNISINADEEILHVKLPRFILQPIVENSFFYGIKNGKIDVNILRYDDKKIIINIEDDGLGMSEADLSRVIFEDTGTEEKSGLGIGLRYVDRMIKTHYGKSYSIKMESKYGSGTIVSIVLPLEELK